MKKVVQWGLISLFVIVLPAIPLFAHGSTKAGDYTVDIGFQNEPTLAGMPNGLDLAVTNSRTSKPVTGLAETLQAEIIFGASKKQLKVEPVEGNDGAYTAAVLPTEPGDYTWHITGKIESLPVDISMTSSPTTFNSVVPASDISFPGKLPSAAALQATTSSAGQVALIGLIVGAAGVLAGVCGLIIGMRRGRAVKAA